MSRTALPLALLLSIACTRATPPDAAPSVDPRLAQFDALMAAYHELDRFHGTWLVAQHGQWTHSGSHGHADRASGAPNGLDTRFRISSMTKQFTAILVLQQVEDGALSLDTTVSDVLPWYRRDTGERVTVRHLLNHWSGIPDGTEQYRRDHPGALPDTLRGRIEAVGMYDLSFEPGTDWAYSNVDYWILGAILEAASGVTWPELLQQRILDPAGMHSSGVAGTPGDDLATGYRRTDDGWADEGDVGLTELHAAGQMYATVGDLARFDAALYDDTLLTAASRQLMFTPADARNYGVGWRIFEREYPGVDHRVTTTWQGGGYRGFASFAQRFFEDRFYLVMLGNSDAMRRPNDLRGSMSDDLIRIFFGMPWEPPVHKEPVEQDPAEWAAHLGPWTYEDRLVYVVADAEGLWVSRRGAYRADALFPEGGGRFFTANDHRETVTFADGAMAWHTLKHDRTWTRATEDLAAYDPFSGVYQGDDDTVCLYVDDGALFEESAGGSRVTRFVALDADTLWATRLPRAGLHAQERDATGRVVAVTESYKGSVTFRGTRIDGDPRADCHTSEPP